MNGPDYSAFLLTSDTSIPLAMLLVFGAAKLLAEICERFGQPGIVGEILAGVIAPFLLGWGILMLWGASQIEAIFIGATMVATSVGITAQVLASRGLLGERSSKVILAAAVIDDVQGLLVLAVVSSMARGKFNIVDILLTPTLAIGFTVVLTIWGGRAMGKVVIRAQGNMYVAEAEFAISLVLLFALSLLAVYVGVAAIVGAFLAGMALAEHVEPRVHDLAHGVSELMVPFFLVGIGLHVDLRIFANPSVLLLALVVLVAAVATIILAPPLIKFAYRDAGRPVTAG
jgi:Kef-type K+ transport system membrane component KefB